MRAVASWLIQLCSLSLASQGLGTVPDATRGHWPGWPLPLPAQSSGSIEKGWQLKNEWRYYVMCITGRNTQCFPEEHLSWLGVGSVWGKASWRRDAKSIPQCTWISILRFLKAPWLLTPARSLLFLNVCLHLPSHLGCFSFWRLHLPFPWSLSVSTVHCLQGDLLKSSAGLGMSSQLFRGSLPPSGWSLSFLMRHRTYFMICSTSRSYNTTCQVLSGLSAFIPCSHCPRPSLLSVLYHLSVLLQEVA